MVEDPWKPLSTSARFSALAPFPRRTWIHPNAPRDDFDLVCEIIWSRTTHLKRGKGESSAQRPVDTDSVFSDHELSNVADGNQKEKDDFLPEIQSMEDDRNDEQQRGKLNLVSNTDSDEEKNSQSDFTLPCPNVSGFSSTKCGGVVNIQG